MATLLSLLERGDARQPALVQPEGPRLTYGRLRAAVGKAAGWLAAEGVRPGDRVALALPNSADAVVFFLAAATAGTAAPLNPVYTEDEFRFYLEDTGARLLLLPPGGGEAARRAAPAGTRVLEVALDRQTTAGHPPAQPPEADAVALVLHTSGTTSRPKRVPLRHRNLVASVANIAGTYRLGPEDVSLCLMPLFHVHGLVASVLSTFATGGTVVVPARFNPLAFWPLVRAQRPTWYTASPTLHQLVLRRAEGRPEVGFRFVRSCSSTLTPEVMRRLEAALDAPVLDAYGMTEASHQMASNPLPPAERRPGSVGCGTGVEVGTMDEAGSLLPPGTAGEVVVRGPNLIDGYEGNPEANQSSFVQGWFRTGDLGILDPDGYLTLVSRIKELINRGGEKIAPREIDEVLEAHPAVAEAVSFGVPHPAWGEEVAAAVVLKAEASQKELVRHCRQRLAEFKVPRTIYFVEAIPRTATGKIQRRNVAASVAGPGPGGR